MSVTPRNTPYSETVVRLSDREIEVGLLMTDGLTYAEIGRHLGLRHETIRSYVRTLRRKTGLRRAPQIAAWFAERRQQIERFADDPDRNRFRWHASRRKTSYDETG